MIHHNCIITRFRRLQANKQTNKCEITDVRTGSCYKLPKMTICLFFPYTSRVDVLGGGGPRVWTISTEFFVAGVIRWRFNTHTDVKAKIKMNNNGRMGGSGADGSEKRYASVGENGEPSTNTLGRRVSGAYRRTYAEYFRYVTTRILRAEFSSTKFITAIKLGYRV